MVEDVELLEEKDEDALVDVEDVDVRCLFYLFVEDFFLFGGDLCLEGCVFFVHVPPSERCEESGSQ